MTIPASASNRWSYNGDAISTEFGYDAVIFAATDLEVYLAGVLQVSGYTVAGIWPTVGGNVTFATPPPVGVDNVVLVRKVPDGQVQDYKEGGAFNAETVEKGFDRQAIAYQQILDQFTRILRLADGDGPASLATLPDKADRASKLLGFDASGDPIVVLGTTEIPVSGYAATLLDDSDAATARATLGLDGASEVIAAGDLADSAYEAVENLVDNPDFAVARRGTTLDATTTPANNDDTCLIERWRLLSDGNDIVDVSRNVTRASLPDGSYSGIRLLVATQNKKFGIVQILKNKDSHALIGGGVCSLSFKARSVGGTISHLRAAVLAWSGTADAVTSDVVSTWNAEGTNPTPAANWAYEKTVADLAGLDTSFNTFVVENITVDTVGANNLAVFIWSDDTTNALGDGLIITDVSLHAGATAKALPRRAYAEEIARCDYHYWRGSPKSSAGALLDGFANSTTEVRFALPHKMFAAPTLSQSGLRLNDGAANHAISSLGNDSTADAISFRAVSTGLTQYRPCSLIYETAGCFLEAEAEL